MNFFITIVALLCALHSSPHVDNAVIFSVGTSDISYSMVDSDESMLLPEFSIGFSRKDTKNRVSGFGLTYSISSDRSFLEDQLIKNKDIFGFRVFSFIDFPIGSFSFGVRSLFDFGFSDNNFVFGPTAGYSFLLGRMNLNINYFKGCADFINFSRFTNSVEARITLPLKGKDN